MLIDPAREVVRGRYPVPCAFAVAALPGGGAIVQSDSLLVTENFLVRWRG